MLLCWPWPARIMEGIMSAQNRHTFLHRFDDEATKAYARRLGCNVCLQLATPALKKRSGRCKAARRLMKFLGSRKKQDADRLLEACQSIRQLAFTYARYQAMKEDASEQK